ncbi:MAG: oligopeptidase B, partial [Saprospiraceae bacterium]
MKMFSILKLSFFTGVLFVSCTNDTINETKKKNVISMNEINVAPPIAKKEAKELIVHGDTRVDNYYWMKLSDEQKNAENLDDQTQEVVDFLNAENDFTKSKLKHTE